MFFEVILLATIQSFIPPSPWPQYDQARELLPVEGGEIVPKTLYRSPIALPTPGQDPKTLLTWRGKDISSLEQRALEKMIPQIALDRLSKPDQTIPDYWIEQYWRDLSAKSLIDMATYLNHVAYEDLERLAFHAAERIKQQTSANISWEQFQNNFYPLLKPFSKLFTDSEPDSLVLKSNSFWRARSYLTDAFGAIMHIESAVGLFLLVPPIAGANQELYIVGAGVIALSQIARLISRHANRELIQLEKSFNYQPELESFFFKILSEQLPHHQIPKNSKERLRWFEAAMNGELQIYQASLTRQTTISVIKTFLEEFERAINNLPKDREGLNSDELENIYTLERIYSAAKKELTDAPLWRIKYRKDLIHRLLEIKAEVKERFTKLGNPRPFEWKPDLPFVTGPGAKALIHLANADNRLELTRLTEVIHVSSPSVLLENYSATLRETTYVIEFDITAEGKIPQKLIFKTKRSDAATAPQMLEFLAKGVLIGVTLSDGNPLQEQNANAISRVLENLFPSTNTAAGRSPCRDALKDKALQPEL